MEAGTEAAASVVVSEAGDRDAAASADSADSAEDGRDVGGGGGYGGGDADDEAAGDDGDGGDAAGSEFGIKEATEVRKQTRNCFSRPVEH